MADQNSTHSTGENTGRQDAAERRRNPADNLTRDARVRGGERSARLQQRDARGQFSGRKKEGADTRGETASNNAGRNAGEPTSENR
jgi:hypothetical protein